MRLRSKVLVGLGSALAALVVALAVQKAGPLPLLALAAGILGCLVLVRPALAVALPVVLLVLAEADPESGQGLGSRLYEFLPVQVTLLEVLLALATLAVALDALRHGRLRPVAPFGIPLLLVGLSILTGAVVATSFGLPRNELLDGVRNILPLMIVPLLVAHVVDTPRRLRGALGLALVLGGVKAVLGLALVLSGSAAAEVDGSRITYFEPTANFLMMAALLTLLAAGLARVELPHWSRWVTPLMFLSLLLSYRRSFWIATVLGALVVLGLGAGRVGRRLIVPAAVVLAGLAFALVSSGALGSLDGPVRDRAASLDPKRVRSNDQDRYRLAERRNVVEEIRRAPLTGIGVGRPWAQRYPLPFANGEARTYAHVGILWWWLKMGVLGALAYLVYMVAAVATAFGVWRRTRDPVVKAAALGGGAALLGLAVAEATATFVGAEVRMTWVMGVVLGLLAAAWRLRDGVPTERPPDALSLPAVP